MRKIVIREGKIIFGIEKWELIILLILSFIMGVSFGFVLGGYSLPVLGV